jgi:hypothetical protein
MVTALLVMAAIGTLMFFGSLLADDSPSNDWTIIAGIIGLVLLMVGFFGATISSSIDEDKRRIKNNESVCSQIPTAQWIEDNHTCIKNGKVILP